MDADSDVSQLLRIHGAAVSTLMSKIRGIDHGNSVTVDELFVLRFVLSDPQSAEDNLLKALDWRRLHRDALIEAQNGVLPFDKEFSQYVKRGLCGWLGNQYLILVVRAGEGNTAGMMKALTVDQCTFNMVLQFELAYKQVDMKTRLTGKLCKVILVLDFQGFGLSNFDRRFIKANGQMTNTIPLVYPSLLKHIVTINVPTTFRIIYSLSRILTPRSMLEKQKICPARTKRRSATECPYLAKFGPTSVEAVPVFLGGTLPTPDNLRLDDEMEEG